MFDSLFVIHQLGNLLSCFNFLLKFTFVGEGYCCFRIKSFIMIPAETCMTCVLVLLHVHTNALCSLRTWI